MCAPVLLAATTALSAVGSYMQGQQASAMADYNAKVQSDNAALQARIGLAQEGQQREKNAALMSDQLAQEGASGFATSTGTPLLVAQASARNLELDALNIRMQSQMRESQYRQGAAISSSEASNYNTASYLSAGTSLLRGAGDAYKLGYIG